MCLHSTLVQHPQHLGVVNWSREQLGLVGFLLYCIYQSSTGLGICKYCSKLFRLWGIGPVSTQIWSCVNISITTHLTQVMSKSGTLSLRWSNPKQWAQSECLYLASKRVRHKSVPIWYHLFGIHTSIIWLFSHGYCLVSFLAQVKRK